MTLVRNTDYSFNFCIDSKNFLIEYQSKEIQIENFISQFDLNEININSFFDLDRLPPLNIDYKKLSEIFETINLIDFITVINKFLDFISKEIPNSDFYFKENIKNKSFIRWNFYIFYINLRLLVMISLHQDFNYSTESHEYFNNFFFQSLLEGN